MENALKIKRCVCSPSYHNQMDTSGARRCWMRPAQGRPQRRWVFVGFFLRRRRATSLDDTPQAPAMCGTRNVGITFLMKKLLNEGTERSARQIGSASHSIALNRQAKFQFGGWRTGPTRAWPIFFSTTARMAQRAAGRAAI